MLVLVHQFRVQVSSLRRRVVRASTSLFLKSKQYSLRKGQVSGRMQPRHGNETFGDLIFVVGLRLVSAPALSFFRETNCSRLWCLPSRSSTCGSLRQAVAFREHAEPSCGPGGTGSSGFGSSAAAGAAGAWSRARCVSSCTFYAVDVGFFGNCLLAAPGLIKALPSPSCLARGGFGDAGAD